ncbi:tRNA(Ser) Um(44) 2'-O-methyltransferase [Aspergillus turcosus]|uniref:tRNA (uracil-O(2)-)-methyltransferase n=1 Tax=Aspergillus turcosus TaxID=1245748 RepID=A0A421DBF1_9EURO|nr:tRNA(Ser) Um(44) 2'-O-methyltransferase [Aspergillus turcosus]
MPRNVRKNPRDVTKLSGRPLAETIEPSPVLKTLQEGWVTSTDLIEGDLSFTPEVIQNMTVFLLANPNLNSSHLFRADILHDSLGVLDPHEKEKSCPDDKSGGTDENTQEEHVEPLAAKSVPGFELKRTIVRRLIPRNKNLDRPLEQTCHFYEADELPPTSTSTDIPQSEECASKTESPRQRFLVIYVPHVSSKEEMPWYHPLLRSLAFLYDFTPSASPEPSEEKKGTGIMSVHFLPYEGEPIQNRLERTLLALLSTQIRLARQTRLDEKPEGGNYNPHKDNVIPRHLVQDTYARLKLKYAADLCNNWVEETEPNKHVFEDLSITAFLIELWRSMYGVVPADERRPDEQEKYDSKFPGFVDVACGNGLLVYVLLSEGYQGWGFDARRRKTWSIFPSSIQERLKEEIYIPKPFADVCTDSEMDIGVKTHTGMFAENTFIISNHADELTVWTPLMAALSNPASPLPFISIPCCSHSLSGARYRYPPPKANKKGSVDRPEDQEVEQNPQPAAGDLKALRAAKQQERTDAGMVNSMYGSLTAKTMSVAEEIGYEVEKTLLRIPSTRNMGVIGGRRRIQEWTERAHSAQASQAVKCGAHDTVGAATTAEKVLERVMAVVQRECAREGGVDVAAKIWIERAKGLHKGQGKGNQPGH